MKTLIKISWRNIWRNKTRSIVIIVAIILGLMGGIFGAAMRLALEKQQFEDTIETQVSHIQIHHPEFIANPEARFRIPDGLQIASDLNKRDDIKVASPRIVFDGMAATANMNAGVRIKGIDPEIEAQTTGLKGLIEEGSYLIEEGRIPSIVIGRQLAEKLNTAVGSRMVLTFQDVEGEVINASFRIEGIYSLPSRAFEERKVFVKKTDINEIIGDEEAVSEIAIVIKNSDDFRVITDGLKEAYPDTKVRHWGDLRPSLYYSLEVLDEVLIWILIIVIMAVSFGLLNTILMSILERARELGMLLAIGMKRVKVFFMIVLETTIISLFGGVIGLTMAYGMISILNNTGVPIPGGEGLSELGYASVLYPDLETGFYFQVVVVLVVFAILASIYPALKAIRLQPAEAVRQE